MVEEEEEERREAHTHKHTHTHSRRLSIRLSGWLQRAINLSCKSCYKGHQYDNSYLRRRDSFFCCLFCCVRRPPPSMEVGALYPFGVRRGESGKEKRFAPLDSRPRERDIQIEPGPTFVNQTLFVLVAEFVSSSRVSSVPKSKAGSSPSYSPSKIGERGKKGRRGFCDKP